MDEERRRRRRDIQKARADLQPAPPAQRRAQRLDLGGRGGTAPSQGRQGRRRGEQEVLLVGSGEEESPVPEQRAVFPAAGELQIRGSSIWTSNFVFSLQSGGGVANAINKRYHTVDRNQRLSREQQQSHPRARVASTTIGSYTQVRPSISYIIICMKSSLTTN